MRLITATKIFMIVICLLTFVQQSITIQQSQSQSHKYWFLKYKNTSSYSVFSTSAEKVWNFCDMKCLYLENYIEEDFVVISFSQEAYRPDFAACYIKDIKSKNGYVLWETKISNSFYEQNCGMDMEDYLQNPSQYEVLKIEGEGRFNYELDYGEIEEMQSSGQ